MHIIKVNVHLVIMSVISKMCSFLEFWTFLVEKHCEHNSRQNCQSPYGGRETVSPHFSDKTLAASNVILYFERKVTEVALLCSELELCTSCFIDQELFCWELSRAVESADNTFTAWGVSFSILTESNVLLPFCIVWQHLLQSSSLLFLMPRESLNIWIYSYMWYNFWLMHKTCIGHCIWSPVVMFNYQNLSWHELDGYGNPLLVIMLWGWRAGKLFIHAPT
jgi:hypothetical protein